MGEQQAGADPVRPGQRYGEAPLAADRRRRRRHPPTQLACCCRWNIPTRRWTAIVAQIDDWVRELSAVAPPDSAPRIGSEDSDDGPNSGSRRVYLDHATDIGAFNPCFPEYGFDHLDAEAASGRVSFPLVYEGPAGIGPRRLSCGVLRLRDPAPELSCRTFRQDPFTVGDFPPADALADRAAL